MFGKHLKWVKWLLSVISEFRESKASLNHTARPCLKTKPHTSLEIRSLVAVYLAASSEPPGRGSGLFLVTALKYNWHTRKLTFSKCKLNSF